MRNTSSLRVFVSDRRTLVVLGAVATVIAILVALSVLCGPGVPPDAERRPDQRGALQETAAAAAQTMSERVAAEPLDSGTTLPLSARPAATGGPELRVRVVDAQQRPCAASEVFVTATDFPNATLLGIDAHQLFRASVHDLLKQHCPVYVTDADGVCLVPAPRADAVVRAYADRGEGSRRIDYEEVGAGSEVVVCIAPVTTSTITVLGGLGEPLANVAIGLVVITHEGASRFHMLRRVTGSSGDFTIGLPAIIAKAVQEEDVPVTVALVPYLAGCSTACCVVDPNNVAAAYVLRTPPLGSVDVRVRRDGVAVDATVMIRARGTKQAIGGREVAWQEPRMSGDKRDVGTVTFENIAAGSRAYELAVDFGGGTVTRPFIGPGYAFHRVAVDMDLSEADVAVVGVLRGEQMRLPPDWMFGTLRPAERVVSRVSTVVDPDGRFAVAGSRGWDGATVVLWSADGGLVTRPTTVRLSPDQRAADLGTLPVSKPVTLAHVRLQDGQSGLSVDPSCLEAVALLELDDGTRAPVIPCFRDGALLLQGFPSPQGTIDLQLASYRYEKISVRVGVGTSPTIRMRPAGRVRIDRAVVAGASTVTLQPSGLQGLDCGDYWEWEGVLPGRFSVEACVNGVTKTVGPVDVRAGELAVLHATQSGSTAPVK
jgi:hypothetical protein